MKNIKKRFTERQGFTLIELIIVLAILGMLAALAIPQFAEVMDNSALKTDKANLAVVETALEVYKADNGGALPEAENFNALVTELKAKEYLKTDRIDSQSGGIFNYQGGEVSFTPKADPDSQ